MKIEEYKEVIYKSKSFFGPLYILKDCKGNYKMIGDIKDCSGCTLPHQKESYDYIISRYQDVVKAFQLLDNKDTNDKIEAPEGIENNAG